MKELELSFRTKERTFEQVACRIEDEQKDGVLVVRGMYVYKVTSKYGSECFEVFRRRVNTMYQTISYPRDSAFGVWAKCCSSLELAMEYFDDQQKWEESKRVGRSTRRRRNG